MRELKEKLPPEISRCEAFESMNYQAEAYLNASEASETSLPTTLRMVQQDTTLSTNTQDQNLQEQSSSNGGTMMSQEPTNTQEPTSKPMDSSRLPTGASSSSSKTGGKELIEQFEPGVYVTYVLHNNGGKIFRRVRFRYFTSSKKFLSSLLRLCKLIIFVFLVVNGDSMSIKQKNGGVARKIGCLRDIVIMFHHQVQELLIQFLHQLQFNHQLLLNNQILIKQRIQKKLLRTSYVYNS